MEYGLSLIDKAGKACGSFYKLSKETGFPQSTISNIRAGDRALPLEWVPVLAEIAGVDPRDALARVMAERLPEGSRARAILGGVRAATVAAMLLFFVSLGLLPNSDAYAATYEKPSKNLICYTSWNVWMKKLAVAIAAVLRFLRGHPFHPKTYGFLLKPLDTPEASPLR